MIMIACDYRNIGLRVWDLMDRMSVTSSRVGFGFMRAIFGVVGVTAIVVGSVRAAG
jgi:hypothetical protein